MIVLGLEPSLTAYGWSIVDVSTSPSKVLAVGCVRTKPMPKKKRHLYQTDQDAIRLNTIAATLAKLVVGLPPESLGFFEKKPESLRIDHIVCEAPAGAQHATTAKALGQTLGLTIGVCAALGRHIRFVQAHEIKMKIGGALHATKEEVARGVLAITGWKSQAGDEDSRDGESDATGAALTLRAEFMDGR